MTDTIEAKFGVSAALWLIAYLAMVAAVVATLVVVRQSVLTKLSTPEALQQWQAWRDEALRRKDRRVPPSDEPPSLILLRDHFGTVLGGSILFSSLLFGTLMIVTRGAWSASRPPDADSGKPQ